MHDETATPLNADEPGPAAAELERLRAEDAAIGWEIQTLFAEGQQLRENGATDAELADINARLAELRRRRPEPSRMVWLELAAENEKHGCTTLADGSVAKILPNGEVLSVQGGSVEWTDSDGAIYKATPADLRRRAVEHKATALAFQAQVTGERLSRTRTRMSCVASVPRRTPQARSPRPAARRAAGIRSGSDPGDDGEPSEPPAARLCEWCGGDISHKNADARHCSDQCRVYANRARDKAEPDRMAVRAVENGVSGRAAVCKCDPPGHLVIEGRCLPCGHDRVEVAT
jgi:hypothetical protein